MLKKKLRFRLCSFESDTVRSDCPPQSLGEIMKYLNIQYRLLVYFASFTVCSGDIKKALKMTS